MRKLLVASLLSLLLPVGASADKIAVLPAGVEDTAQAELPALFDDVLLTAVQGSTDDEVVGMDDIAAVIGFERQKELLGCDDVTCFADIGGALGVQRLVSFKVARLGTDWVVTAKIINIITSAAESRLTRMVPGDARDLIENTPTIVAALFGKETPAPGPPPVATPPPGSLRIDGTPPGGICQVGDRSLGKAPCRADDLPPGTYDVSVSQPGYQPFRRTVEVTSGARAKVAYTLEPSLVPVALASQPPGAEIRIDGEVRGTTDTRLDLAPGMYALWLTMDDREDLEQPLQVATGKPLSLALTLEPGLSSEQRSSQTARLISGAILSTVGAVALSIFAWQGSEAQAKDQAMVDDPPTNLSDLETRGQAVRDQSLVADISLAAGSAVTALGASLLISVVF